jgi:hypothetical protein
MAMSLNLSLLHPTYDAGLLSWAQWRAKASKSVGQRSGAGSGMCSSLYLPILAARQIR